MSPRRLETIFEQSQVPLPLVARQKFVGRYANFAG
jgi:hypothetical protein